MVSRYQVILVIASVVGVLSLAAVITLIVLWFIVLAPFQDYAVVIDAGSTHSKVFLYTWPADKSDGIGTTSRISQVNACDVPGDAVSSITNPTQDNVKQYFDSAMTACTKDIPSTRKSRTLIFPGATAGLRLLNITNPPYISALLTGIRDYFSTLGLLFLSPENQVRIISGSEEGLSGWISTNILMQQLFVNNQPLETYGVLEIGGASAQISFIALNATSERYTMNLFNTNYDVYSYSYLCYGQEQLRLIYQGLLVQQQANGSIIVDDPCLQSGYSQNITYNALYSTACAISRYTAPTGFNTTTNITFRGTGNYANCRTRMLTLFNRTSCSSLSSCSFNNVYQPIPISSSLKFVGISAIYQIFNSFASRIPLSADSSGNYDLALTNKTQIDATIGAICNEPWANLTNPDTRYRPLLCANAVYHWTLFDYGYNMTSDNFKNVKMVNKIDSNDIGWTLGYMINQTNYLDPEYRPTRLLTQAEFIGIIICFLVILVVSIITIIITCIIYKRRQKVQEKHFN